MPKTPDTPGLCFHPLTAERWDDLVELFETDSITRTCWCMLTRLSAGEARALRPADRKQMLARLVERGPPPGLLAYRDGTAVGWLAVAPRSATPDWNRGRKSSAAENESDATAAGCWGASCFFVRAGFRKQGLTAELLEAGIAHARAHGAERLEACPMSHDDKRSAVGMCVGPKRIFERAGFETVLERKPGRPLMRLALKKPAARKKSTLPKRPASKRNSGD